MYGSLWQGCGCLTAWEFLLRGGAAILADSQNGDIITLSGTNIPIAMLEELIIYTLIHIIMFV
jgi:hypothetical protein